MTASKGPVLLVVDGVRAMVGSSKLAVDVESRSFADDKVLFWIWEARIILGQRGMASGLRECEERSTYFEQAKGSSKLPGTAWTTMFSSLTPSSRSL